MFCSVLIELLQYSGLILYLIHTNCTTLVHLINQWKANNLDIWNYKYHDPTEKNLDHSEQDLGEHADSTWPVCLTMLRKRWQHLRQEENLIYQLQDPITDNLNHCQSCLNQSYAYNDLHMGVWPQLFDGVARVAIYAGARAIDDGHGDISMDQANALQHWTLGPTIGNRHVFESRFTTIGDKALAM